MTIATERLNLTQTLSKLSLQDYLNYRDASDTRYELLNGELCPMSLGTIQHSKVIRFLDRAFDSDIQRSQNPWVVLASLMAVQSPRGRRWDTARIPDVLILPVNQYDAMTNGAVITLDQKPPLLVVEVVSPSTKTEDYRSKWIEYCALDIPEYWIVDPIDACVTVCVLDEGSYTNTKFKGEKPVVSPLFPEIVLTCDVILSGKV
jgi:Uma2 family endonuclease